MTRVWLTEWEWACCGDAFKIGDVVDFGIETRSPHAALADMLGSALVATVDAIESHHEEDFADRVRGRVVAVNEVRHEVIERRTLRRPGHGAPADAVMPADGDEWPFVGREIGNGVVAGSRPTRFIIETVSVPNTAELTSVEGVRMPVSNLDEPLPSMAELTSEASSPRSAHSLVGWLVDVEEPLPIRPARVRSTASPA